MLFSILQSIYISIQEKQQQLSSSLRAAQALHSGTIQERLTTKKPEEHKGFFKNIFQKKENYE